MEQELKAAKQHLGMYGKVQTALPADFPAWH